MADPSGRDEARLEERREARKELLAKGVSTMTGPQTRRGNRPARWRRWSLWSLLPVLLAALIPAGAAAQEPAPEPLPYGRLAVEGVASRNVVPNQATIDFGVRQEAASAQAAFDGAQFVLSTVVTALKANDVPEEAMRTTGLTLHPVYRYDEGTPELVGYVAEGSVRVETRELRRLANLIDAAVAAGANRIARLQYSYSGERALQEELLSEAALQARTKAERIAAALGQQVKSVAQVRESSSRPITLQRSAAFEAATDGAAVALPGTMTVESRIEVEFILAPEKPMTGFPAEATPAPATAGEEGPAGPETESAQASNGA